jgi:hypothetical protein
MYSSLLSKNVKIYIYRIIILPVVFMGVKLGLSRKRQNRVLKMIDGPKRDEVRGDCKRAK